MLTNDVVSFEQLGPDLLQPRTMACTHFPGSPFPTDPFGKLLFHEKKSILATGTTPFLPFRSFGRGYNSVIIAVI